MIQRKEKRKGRGRPPVHDPDLIRALLAEREHSGETYVDLETRSGIPAGTLSAWSRRLRSAASELPPFLEIELPGLGSADEIAQSSGFELVVDTSHGSCRVLIAAGFDSGELKRLLATLEARC